MYHIWHFGHERVKHLGHLQLLLLKRLELILKLLHALATLLGDPGEVGVGR